MFRRLPRVSRLASTSRHVPVSPFPRLQSRASGLQNGCSRDFARPATVARDQPLAHDHPRRAHPPLCVASEVLAVDVIAVGTLGLGLPLDAVPPGGVLGRGPDGLHSLAATVPDDDPDRLGLWAEVVGDLVAQGDGAQRWPVDRPVSLAAQAAPGPAAGSPLRSERQRPLTLPSRPRPPQTQMQQQAEEPAEEQAAKGGAEQQQRPARPRSCRTPS